MENLIRAHLSNLIYQIIRIFLFGILNFVVPYGYVMLATLMLLQSNIFVEVLEPSNGCD